MKVRAGGGHNMPIKRWFNNQASRRQAWEAKLTWVRVRHNDLEQLKKCCLWLTESPKIRRLGLLFHKGEKIHQLYFGIPSAGVAVFEQMERDYGFQTAPMPSYICLPGLRKMKFVEQLEWKRPFYAHLDGTALFVQVGEEGTLFPTAEEKLVTSWEIPSLDGLLPKLDIDIYGDGESAFQSIKGWWLGFGCNTNKPLKFSGKINLYGNEQAAAAWLEPVAMTSLANSQKGLVILDGKGDLVPTLKRQECVVSRLERDLIYLDLDSPIVSSGFNPMAKAPFEAEEDFLVRLKQWFSIMGLPKTSLDLIQKAVKDGIRTLAELDRWVTLPEQQRMPQKIARLKRILNRLLAQRAVRDRLEWPLNPFKPLPNGALLFSCQQRGWEQNQMMLAILLGIIGQSEMNLILHGLDWKSIEVGKIYSQLKCRNIIISNGPLLKQSLQVFTTSHPDRAKLITHRFFEDDEYSEEVISTLKPGESLLRNSEKQIAMARWS